MTITLVRYGCKSTEGRQDYKIEFRITYKDREASIDIGKFKDNYNKDRKPRYFNCNIYRHMAKDCQKMKKKKKKPGNATSATK